MNTEQKIVFQVRTTQSTIDLLKKISEIERRDYGDQLAIIIEQEWARRQHAEQAESPAQKKSK